MAGFFNGGNKPSDSVKVVTFFFIFDRLGNHIIQNFKTLDYVRVVNWAHGEEVMARYHISRSILQLSHSDGCILKYMNNLKVPVNSLS